MDYKRQYDLLMEKARQRGTVEGYKERHHIIPRCMGGSNKKENLVELTAKEHYVAHHLLYMLHKDSKTAMAWWMMSRKGNTTQERIKLTATQYERVKTVIAETNRFSNTHSKINKGIPKSPEHRAKLSAALKGRPKTPEHRAKVSKGLTGKVLSVETRKRISETKKRGSLR